MKKLLLILLVFATLVNAKNTISQKTFKLLQKVQKLSEEKKYKKALDILNPFIIKISKTKRNQAKFYAYQAYANIYINKDEYKKVANTYLKMLSLGILKDKGKDQMKFSLSQIYLSDSFYKKSLKYSYEILNSKNIKKSNIIRNIALAYYYDEKYKKSLPYIKNTIKEEKNKESWYRMLYSAQVQIKNYKNAIKTLKYMTVTYPNNENYWMQLVSLFQTTKQDKKTLATLELAYNKKYISQKKHTLFYVKLLLQNQLYNKASLLIEKSFKNTNLDKNKKNFDLLIMSQLNAKNNKQLIYELETSTYSNTNKYKIMLANIYYNNEEYNKTIKLLKNYDFIKKSNEEGKKYTLIALSLHELDKKSEIKKYLKLAYLNKYEKKRAKRIAKSLGIKI